VDRSALALFWTEKGLEEFPNACAGSPTAVFWSTILAIECFNSSAIMLIPSTAAVECATTKPPSRVCRVDTNTLPRATDTPPLLPPLAEVAGPSANRFRSWKHRRRVGESK
jgi:hypothetical protein